MNAVRLIRRRRPVVQNQGAARLTLTATLVAAALISEGAVPRTLDPMPVNPHISALPDVPIPSSSSPMLVVTWSAAPVTLSTFVARR
jgi:hypothetical protein